MKKRIKSFIALGLNLLSIIGYFLGIISAKEQIPNFAFTVANGIGILFVLISLFSWVIYLFRNIKIVKRFLLYHSAPKKNYVLLEKNIEYCFLSRENLTYRKEYLIKSRVNSVESLTDRYVWSKGNTNPKCAINALGNDTIGRESSDVQWQYYCILFSTPCNRNKEHRTGIEMKNLYDPKHESAPFISTGIFERTIKLKMEVKLHNAVRIKKDSVYVNVYSRYNDRVPVETIHIVPQYDNDYCSLSYEIKYPLYDARYQLDWEFV